jgi:beta-mannosidase
MHIQSLVGDWQFRQAGKNDAWLPATVPGGVHTDLMAAGKIPDPFVGDNEKRVQWVGESDWEYRLCFDAPSDLLAEERIYLVCDGLDTLATITLNGQRLGDTDNMFRQYRWEVGSLLQTGENELHIHFRSPVAHITPLQQKRPLRGVAAAIPGGPYVRKAPCQFGWDWGPQLPPIGIWKDLRLEGRSVAELEDVHLRQFHEDGRVLVTATVTVEPYQSVPLTAQLRITAPDGKVLESEMQIGGETQTLAVPIDRPQLWWPNDYPSPAAGSEQPLYNVQVSLLADDRVHDQRTYQMGLRKIELRREPDEWGESFTFVVNGMPIFAKGSNWIPADSFPTRISDEHMERLIRDAAATHHNMLRVWGGGFYEEERFYDLCDRYGILVWQDFAFSCSIYPLNDEAFLENVRVEVIENIRRLRHRASLALWCGNNEMEWGWVGWGWDQPENADLKQAYDQFFHHTLPEWCAAEDPDHSYWPSSPSSGTPFLSPNGDRKGDAHYWEVWHGDKPFSAFRDQYPRFMSEFGFQSLPPLETVRAYADESEWNMTSYVMEHHQRSPIGNSKIITYMTDHFQLAKDFESLVYLTQVLQAEAIRIGVEHWRHNRLCTGGTLYWQLNDCWPVASWSSLDYFGRWKALHYVTRRFYAPVLLTAEEGQPRVSGPSGGDPHRIRWSMETLEGGELTTGELVMSVEQALQLLGTPQPASESQKPEVSIYLTNDLTSTWQGTVCWSLEFLDGRVLEAGRESVAVPALSAASVCTLDFNEYLGGTLSTTPVSGTPSLPYGEGQEDTRQVENPREVVLVYELWQEDERLSVGVIPFVPNKHLALVAPSLAVDTRQVDNQLVIELKAQSLARFVALALDGADVVFSDNFFDLPAGRTITVTCPMPDGWNLDRARTALEARSLYESYA